MTIREFLVKTGCLPNLAGFDYLIRAVEIVKEKKKISITKELYPILGKEFKSSASKVERAMRHIVSNKISTKQYGMIGLQKRPSNSELIYYFAAMQEDK